MSADPAEEQGQPPGSVSLWEAVRRTPATAGLIVVCAVVALWTGLGSSLEAVRWLTFVDLIDTGASFPGLADGQAWRLLTPIFIHFGIVHLIFNLMWLFDLGGVIEARWRSFHFLRLVVIIGVIANAAQFAVNWDFAHGVRYANALSGGMSGVVYGLFGYVWIRGRREPSLNVRLHQQTVVLMLGWLVFCMTGMMGYIGNTAHAVGLLVGVLAGLVDSRTAKRTE